MSVTVICPLYKSREYINSLHNSLLMQEDVDLKVVKYILTETGDGVDKIVREMDKVDLTVISIDEFSHSLTRERAAMESNSDILVFITQDIIIKDKKWLSKLCKPIYEGKCEAAFSRQICDNQSIEKYTRVNNYPKESRIVSKDDVERLGIMTFFFSDAASAIKTDVYKKLNGYDGKDLLTNEDMYLAYKLINNGYRIMYNADAEVIHSHDYKFMQLFKRYFDQGAFLSDNAYLTQYGANGSALKLLKVVAVESLKDKNFKAFFNIIPNFAARFLGNQAGKRYKKMPIEKIKEYSGNVGYWNRIKKQ
ncbi:glycosyltransferase family 2 protein [Clostridium sp.]|uniref:glycosyltransferase family 2 protein n=1 Tax=Clostridium sp. TaxID=1506 RepID=UPI003990D8B3